MNFQFLIDSIPALIHTGLPNGDLDYFNQTWLTYAGLSLEDLQGWKWTAAIHPEDVAGIVEKWRTAVATGEPFEHEARVRRADGEYRWMFHHKVPLRNERGNIVKWYGTSIDIEDRKRAEERVRQDEKDLRQLIDAIPQHVVVLEADGSLLYVNQIALEYTGLTLKETLGKDALAKIFQPDDLERAVGERQHAISRGVQWDAEVRIRGKDGNYRWFIIRLNPLRDEQGRILRWYGTSTDIEDRKRAEDALRRSRAYLTEAQSLSHTGSFAYNPGSGKTLYWSEELFRIFGLDPQRGIPDHDESRRLVHPDDRGRVSEACLKGFREKAHFSQDYRLLLHDGTVKHLHVIWHPVLDKDGEVVEYVGTAADVTERKQAEDALRRSRAYLTEAQSLSHTGSFGWKTSTGELLWSEETFRIFEYDQTIKPSVELVLQRVYPEDVALVKETIERAAHYGKDFDFEHRLLMPDGSVKHVHIVAHALSDASGGIEFVGAVMDITATRKAEEKIRQNEKELRTIIETIPAFIGTNLPDGYVDFVSQSFLDYLGLSREQWLGRGWMIVTHPDDVDLAVTRSQAAFASGEPIEHEQRLRRADGEYRWFFSRNVPLHDEKGNIVKWYGALFDVDDRKRAEDSLRTALEEIKKLRDQLYHENIALREEIDKASMFEEIVGTSPALRSVLARVAKVAPTDSTVLLTGETGTGKELIARAIHKRSQRSSRAFVSVSCAVIPRDLIASELFGHEKGAFTGAAQRHLGRFELAEGGTIFLDEIGELPAETQIALLRVLQEHEIERVGGTGSIRSDVRVIAATNRDLQAAIAAGTFRSDLFYRLNVFPIEIPPLRERREDIPLLVEYFIDRYARKAGKSIRRVNKKSLDLLQSYPWPGNIRELQNVIERSVIVCETETFSVDESWLSRQPLATESKNPLDLSQQLAAQEKEMIEAALRESQGRVYGPSGAATKLGIARSTLESKIRSLKINKNRFKTANLADVD